MRIRILHGRWKCPFKLPLISDGGIIVAEEQCQLPKGHPGPHKGPHGQVVINAEDTDKWLHGQPKKIWRAT